MKQPPCCARRAGQLRHNQNNLRVLAAKAAKKDQDGQDITKLKAMIDRAKAAIAEDQKSIEDHEAEHAGEAVA